MRKAILWGCTLALMAPRFGTADSVSLMSLRSDGSNGDFNAYLAANSYDGTSFFLNTDTGGMIAGEYNPYYQVIFGYQLAGITPTSVTTSNGTVNAFNFSSFNLPQGDSLTLYGNSAAAILANGSVTIAGNLQVWSNAGAAGNGGLSSYSGGNPQPANAGGGVGGGGAGGGGYGYRAYNDHGTGGSGGGGGMVTPGTDGTSGNSGGGGGGGSAVDLSILQGGGGGGGGGGCGLYCSDNGQNGGQGGGAVFFGATTDFTITTTGIIAADGWGGQSINDSGVGDGGGGAGGDLWFSAAGTWANYGLVSAQGAAGGTFNGEPYYPIQEAGSGGGGYVYIDPNSIINDGVINVGNGAGGIGGLVTFDGPLSGTGTVEGDISPEPGTMLLMLIGVAGGLLARQRRWFRRV